MDLSETIDSKSAEEVRKKYNGSTEFFSGINPLIENQPIVWDLSKNESLVFTALNSLQKTGMCMSMKLFIEKDELFLLTGYESGLIALSNVTQNSLLTTFRSHSEPVLSLDCYPPKKLILTGSAEKKISTLIYSHDKISEKGEGILLKNAGISDIKIRMDGKIFATAGWDSKIRVFQTKDNKPLAILTFHRESVLTIGFPSFYIGPDQKPNPESDSTPKVDLNLDLVLDLNKYSSLLVAGSKDTRVSLWELY